MLHYKAKFEEVTSLIPNWKWVELKFGLLNYYLSEKEIINYANQLLDSEVECWDQVVQLAIADEEEVDGLLDELILHEEEIDEQMIESKWIFAFVYHAFNYLTTSMYSIIEDVYDEFNYPDEIKSLVYYMPCEDGVPIEEKLKMYIDENCEKWH